MDTVVWGCTTADCSHSSILVSTEWVYMKQTNAGWCESVFSLLYYFVACKWYQLYNTFVCTVILHWVGIVFHIHLTQVCLRTIFTSNSRILILKLWVVYFDYKSLDSSVNINACPPTDLTGSRLDSVPRHPPAPHWPRARLSLFCLPPLPLCGLPLLVCGSFQATDTIPTHQLWG